MKVLLIEDEQRAAQRLEKLIMEIIPSAQILECLDSVEAVTEWFSSQQETPDVLFMDIHLADGSAFEIFNNTEIHQPVIFTTAYDQYAIEAFKVNAIDYLLKPIKKEELRQALDRYSSTHQASAKSAIDYSEFAKYLQNNHTKKLKRFLIRIGQTLKTVDLRDVAYFYTENKITFVMSNEGKRYPIDYTLETLENELDKEQYFRVNRQYIVQVSAITKMVAVSKSRVKLFLEPCGHETIVSTERSGKFKKWLVGKE